MRKNVTWYRYRPRSSKEYDPNDPHFDPLHPPEGYPREELEKEWGETFDDKPESKDRAQSADQ